MKNDLKDYKPQSFDMDDEEVAWAAVAAIVLILFLNWKDVL